MELNFPLILDGATGTELQKRGYGGGGCAEQWVLEHPDAIREIQRVGKEKLEEKGFKGAAILFGWLYQGLYLMSRYRSLKATGQVSNAREVSVERASLIAGLGLSE